jgi:hypothetical protein
MQILCQKPGKRTRTKKLVIIPDNRRGRSRFRDFHWKLQHPIAIAFAEIWRAMEFSSVPNPVDGNGCFANFVV